MCLQHNLTSFAEFKSLMLLLKAMFPEFSDKFNNVWPNSRQDRCMAMAIKYSVHFKNPTFELHIIGFISED